MPTDVETDVENKLHLLSEDIESYNYKLIGIESVLERHDGKGLKIVLAVRNEDGEVRVVVCEIPKS